MDWNALLSTLIEVSVPIVLLLLYRHIRPTIEQGMKTNNRAAAMQEFDRVVEAVVSDMSQNIVGKLKGAGKFDEKSANQVKQKAVVKVLEGLSASSYEVLSTEFKSGLEDRIRSEIERAVVSQKR